ncbi:MAG: hypothetical protein IJN57_06975 [Oscillospiraceae bacterium]|nr:hypothetical protein [Oscillospiraceae bacterium]
MAADGYLNFDTQIDTGGFNRGLGSISASLGSVKSMLGSIAGAVGLAFSAKAIVDFGREALGLASDMQEVQNVVDTAFGSMAYRMEEFADSAVQLYGISRLTAKRTGSVFAAMAGGMGLAQETASDMAIALTGLSADMASFYNVEQEVASTALKSVFTGETETLKQFGIVMTQANLEAYALSQGITKSLQAMTEAEKVQLRYGYVMQSTALAQGDFAKTSDGWANQLRILTEQWKEFATIIGDALLNIALPALRTLNNAMASLIRYTNTAYDALAAFFGWETQIGAGAAGIASAISDGTANQDAMTEAVKDTAKAQKNVLAGFDKITKLSGSSDDSASSAAASAVTDMGGYSADAPPEKKSPLAGMVPPVDVRPILDSFRSLREALAPILGHIRDGVLWLYDNVLVPLGKWTIEKAAPAAIHMLSGAFELLGAYISALRPYWQWLWDTFLQPLASWTGGLAVTALEGLAEVFGWLADEIDAHAWMMEPLLAGATMAVEGIKTLLLGLWEKYGKPFFAWCVTEVAAIGKTLSDFWTKWGRPILTGLAAAFGNMANILKKYWETILLPVFTKLGQTIKGLWENHLRPYRDKFMDMVGKLITAATEIYNGFIYPVASWLLEYLGPAFAAYVGEVIDYIGGMAGFLIDACGNIVDAFSGWIDFIAGVFTGDWERAWDGIRQYFSGIIDAIGNIFLAFNHKAIDLMIDAADGIKKAFANIATWFGDKFRRAWSNIKTAFSAVGDWFGDRWDEITGIFSGVGEWFSRKFSDAYALVQKAFEGARSYFEDVVEGIKSPFTTLQGWFSGIWDGISSGTKHGINLLLSSLDSMAGAVETLLNGIVDGLNAALSFSVPDNVPTYGGLSFGLNLSHVDIPPLPRLATGTVVPANYGEFLAVLGDNRREAEIVSPVSAMEKAMENVLARRGESGDIHLNIDLDGKRVYQTVIRRNNESIRMTGKNPLSPVKGVTT